MLAGFCDGLICGCFSYMYPTMEEMAYQINYVMAHFGLKTFIGFGVGAGAHVLAKFAISNPEKVDICHEEIGYHTKVHREFYTRKKETLVVLWPVIPTSDPKMMGLNHGCTRIDLYLLNTTWS